MTNGFSQSIAEFVEILFVQMNFHFYKIAIVEFAAFTFSDGNVIIIVSCGFHIEKISALTSTNTL